MKKIVNIFLCILSCLIITSCGNSDMIKEDIFSDKENVELFSNDEYTIFFQKYNQDKMIYYYEELFGTSNALNFIVQYDYEYIYKSDKQVDDNLTNILYQTILTNINEIKEEYKINDLYIKENRCSERYCFTVNNPNQYDMNIVLIELYIPFIFLDKNTNNITYFALPMYRYELLKHDDMINGFDGKEIEFNKFISTYDIKKK